MILSNWGTTTRERPPNPSDNYIHEKELGDLFLEGLFTGCSLEYEERTREIKIKYEKKEKKECKEKLEVKMNNLK